MTVYEGMYCYFMESSTPNINPLELVVSYAE
jgi:hypothetical protein